MIARTCGVIAGAIVFVWIVHQVNKPHGPPERLSDNQKLVIETQVRDLAFLGQLEFGQGGDPVSPPTVRYFVDDVRNIAEAKCDRARVIHHEPEWTVAVNERLAAHCFNELVYETLPHEVAHLVACPISPRWDEHGAQWENITRYLGAEPKRYHTCVQP